MARKMSKTEAIMFLEKQCNTHRRAEKYYESHDPEREMEEFGIVNRYNDVIALIRHLRFPKKRKVVDV